MTQETLKIALDALETELSIDWTNNDEFNASAEKMYEAIVAIKAALAQPEQEPVALVIDGVLVKSELPEKYTGHLYTQPSQRTWVGLTDEEIEQLHTAWVLGGGFRQLCNAIEANIKEKNFV